MRIPFSAQLEVVENCTHRCVHCYNESSSDKKSSRVVGRDVIDALSEEDIFSVVLTGGEPLLGEDMLEYSIKQFTDSNIDVSVNSNLYLLSDGHINLFKQYGIEGVLASILGPNAEAHDSITKVKGSFKRTLSSLERLASSGIKSAANMVVLPQNKDYVYETGDMLSKEVGLKIFCATPAVPNEISKNNILTKEEYIRVLDDLSFLSEHGIHTDVLHPTLPCIFDSKEQREKYKHFLMNRACGSSRSTLTVSVDGGVRPCSHSSNVYGDITKSFLSEILGVMDSWVNKKLVPTECNPCSYVDYCKGGCRVSSEIISGDLTDKHHYMGKPILEKEDVFSKLRITPDFYSLEKTHLPLKFREEEDGLYSIFGTLDSNAIVDGIGLGIVRRFAAGANYENIIEGLNTKEKSLVDRRIGYLFNRGLLVQNYN